MNRYLAFLLFLLGLGHSAFAQQSETILNLNKPERQAWFSDLGLGMFIHWSFDVQLGMVISHSMVGASEDYLNRYIHELPKTFDPENFDPQQWAKAARLAGMKYIVFTTKHHNGFCMFDTKTTDFNIMNTAYARDVTRMVVDACRKEGLAVGLYFSPDDFYFLHEQGTLISRNRPEAMPKNNPELTAYIRKQMAELMTNYGDIDIVFLDGVDQYGKTELAKVCWEINPDVVVTRGAIETPEQETPDTPIPAPWEACYTLGDQWQFRPTNEQYKTANETIRKFIEIRSKGGNFLLNFGPEADGTFPKDQLGVLNEFALWMFINQEAFDGTVSLPFTHEGNVWYLKKKGEPVVYAFLLEDNWELGARKTYQLNHFKANAATKISVLGQNGKVLEYQPDIDPTPAIKNTANGIEISVMRAQRIYNDRKWPNPVVVKLENVELK